MAASAGDGVTPSNRKEIPQPAERFSEEENERLRLLTMSGFNRCVLVTVNIPIDFSFLTFFSAYQQAMRSTDWPVKRPLLDMSNIITAKSLKGSFGRKKEGKALTTLRACSKLIAYFQGEVTL